MAIKKLFSKISHLKLYQNRVQTDDYCEIVFYNRDSAEWHQILTDIMGDARKHAGITPNANDMELTRQSGGIRTDQTLFEKKTGKLTVIAKFWPWKDGLHTTLKIALLRE